MNFVSVKKKVQLSHSFHARGYNTDGQSLANASETKIFDASCVCLFIIVQCIMAILPRRSSRFVVFVLLLVIISSLYNLSSYRHDDLRQDIHQVYQKVKLGQKQAFIQTATETAIDGPFDNNAIKSLCASKNWTEGLITTCGTPQGGVSNVRNVFLNCVRYAIEAGGKWPAAALTR